MNKYYVYVYLDPRKKGKYVYDDYVFDYEPFYVGKGSSNRLYVHLQKKRLKYDNNLLKKRIIEKIHLETNKPPIIVKIEENLNEERAFEIEEKLIELIGRRHLKTGSLVNLTAGGDGIRDPDGSIKKKISESHKGKVLTKKHKEKIRKGNIEFNQNNVRWTKKEREKLSAKLKGRNITWGDKISKANTGNTLSKETKRKMSEGRRGSENHQWKNIDIDRIYDLRYNQKLTINKISDIMNISVSTVRRKLKGFKNGNK